MKKLTSFQRPNWTFFTILFSCIFGIAIYAACNEKPRFEFATPTTPLSFPKDLASHPEYQTEWWYVTGHLTSEAGKSYGYELTFFRVGLKGESEGIEAKQIYLGHFALSDISTRKFYFTEKQSRGKFGDAGASAEYFKTYLGNWSIQELGNYMLLQAETDTFSLALVLEPLKKPVLHGKNGYSQKGPESSNASMYFSYTRLKTTGAVTVLGKRETVRGESWHDHEFGTSQLSQGVLGWDWFSLQFENGTELMLYQLREESGMSPFSSGTFIQEDGTTISLTAGDFGIKPTLFYESSKSGARYPKAWTVSIPKLLMELEIQTNIEDQELLTNASTRVTYWEGSVSANLKTNGVNPNSREIRAKGYVELTGYAKPFEQNF
ncbi:MAG: lipocalin-like domain-containing protein [Chloroherpetonaceae bacterium]|nr:lipocalin-like domain-containing protein [Chloroherpetonaceae bacterium]